jgi:hypothetical protein
MMAHTAGNIAARLISVTWKRISMRMINTCHDDEHSYRQAGPTILASRHTTLAHTEMNICR